MVGGVGSRLRPYTHSLPKPLLTANGISPVENSIKNIKKENDLRKIYLVLGYRKSIFKKWVKQKKLKKISFVYEKKPLGTAGSLKKFIQKKFHNIILINGDLFFQTNLNNLINYHEKNNFDATICTKRNITNIPYAILKKRKNKKILQEKPKIYHIINTGIYVLNKNFLKKFFFLKKNKKQNYFNMPDLINYVRNNKLGTYNIGSKWIDIGNIYDFKKASREMKFW